jgi:hypothetical protein
MRCCSRSSTCFADHAAERVVAVRRRVRRERQMMLLGGVAQRVEHAAGLDARALARRVELEDAVQILREIQHDGDVAALSAQARAATARQHRRAMLPARGDRRDDGIDRARDDDADRDLPVVGPVGRVERPAADVEAYFAVDGGEEVTLERSVSGVRHVTLTPRTGVRRRP